MNGAKELAALLGLGLLAAISAWMAILVIVLAYAIVRLVVEAIR